MEYPRLTICLFTCRRPGYAERTLRALLDDFVYPDKVAVHVADDGSPEEQTRYLLEVAGGYEEVRGTSWTNAEGRGYGASYNLASQVTHAHSEIVLCLEDDWELSVAADFGHWAQILAESARLEYSGPRIGCIRMGYVGWTQELRGRFVTVLDEPLLLLDPESPEPHVFAGHPRLETVEWQRSVGEWPEGLNAGATEFAVAQRPEARRGVAWPLALHPFQGLFSHFGTVQARTDQ